MKPRLLDLFCGAGGAAMGYARAGFEVVGVDINPQPHYPFAFVQADALEYVRGFTDPMHWVSDAFSAIHASPPCQAYSDLRHRTGAWYPDLVAPTRTLLQSTGVPWVIENVEGSPLIEPIRLCGSSFGIGVRRHRLFESSLFLFGPPSCRHDLQPEPVDVSGTGGRGSAPRRKLNGGKSRKPLNLDQARSVMGIDWMTRRELSQAIPPVYTEWIGQQLLQVVERAA